MKILHTIRSVNPAGGGVIEVVRQFSGVMERQGHTVAVASLDAPGDAWVKEFPHRVHALGPVATGYGRTTNFTSWLRDHHTEFDCVVVNGLWQFNSFGTRQALHGTGTPYFVFPHGMLDPWFKRAYPLKHLKKWLYWPWAEYRVLRDARAALFTCEEEKILARQSFWLYSCREQVVPLGIATPPGDAEKQRSLFLQQFPGLAGQRIILFLGRIHEKKGCDLLLQAFAPFAKKDPRLQLVIAGPDQTGWRATLEKLAETLGVTRQVSWPGMLGGDLKWGAFHAAEAFALPSHQENFGIVVAEAAACGLPVLISNQVNIWREIEADGAGLVAPDTLDGTSRLLSGWLEMPDAAKSEMRARAQKCFNDRFEIGHATGQFLKTLRECGVKG